MDRFTVVTEMDKRTEVSMRDAHGWTQKVAESLSNIERRDGEVKAWTYVATLAEIEAQVHLNLDGPLAGVPFGVKDVIDVAGMPTRCGSSVPAEPSKPFDACCVATLRRAGAVPVGKTVTAEYAFRAPGPTRNPHNLDHTPGGSSSGSAAAVAAGMVPFALGTQTGGSMIRPAAYCGVVGFKPSFGSVFRDGLKLTCESLDVIGWYARSVVDADAVARVLTPLQLRDAARKARPTRIALVPSNPEHELEPHAELALWRACRTIEAHGVRCEVAEGFTRSKALNRVHQVVMEYEFARSLAPVVRRHANMLSPALLDTVRRGLAIPDEQYLARRAEQEAWRREWVEMFGEADLILTPSAPGPAPKGLASTGSSAFNKIWSALGWPCLHLPIASDPGGLPVGIQLVGKFEADIDLLTWGSWLHDVLNSRARNES